ncbi:MAG: two-component system OmpR family response regulator [Verrucomicrobiales bacterium]
MLANPIFNMTRILLVDDEPGFTAALMINLEETGKFTVDVVNDPRNALRKALEFKPEVILLDVVMPGLDGGDVLTLFRSEKQLLDTPVILVTAMVDPTKTAAGLGVVEEAGQIMIAKPVQMDVLLQVIENSLGRPV